MPGLDCTGPMGRGPMTGRGRGICTAGRFSHGYYFRPRRPAGLGRGRGFGRGMTWEARYAPGFGGPVFSTAWRAGYAVDPTREIEMLRSEAADLKQDLEQINRRIEELEQTPSES